MGNVIHWTWTLPSLGHGGKFEDDKFVWSDRGTGGDRLIVVIEGVTMAVPKLTNIRLRITNRSSWLLRTIGAVWISASWLSIVAVAVGAFVSIVTRRNLSATAAISGKIRPAGSPP